MNIAVLAVIYHEPSWHRTMVCLSKSEMRPPLFVVDRDGTGGLAEAFNRGFQQNQLNYYDLVWFITNIEFGPTTLTRLVREMGLLKDYIAISPAFASDHPHTRPLRADETRETPFVEFTAPLVRGSLYSQFPLDNTMPYSGHDLDWGYRVRKAGYKVGVYHGAEINHTYIRHSDKSHPVTKARMRLRMSQEEPTKQLLAKRYGDDWFNKLRYHY